MFYDQAGMCEASRTALACIAAEMGQVDCMRVMHQTQIILDGSLSCAAATVGNLSCLRVAHEVGDQWTAASIQPAANQGDWRQNLASR